MSDGGIPNFWEDVLLYRDGVNMRLPSTPDDVAVITYEGTPTTPAHVSVVDRDGRIIHNWEVDGRSWIPHEDADRLIEPYQTAVRGGAYSQLFSTETAKISESLLTKYDLLTIYDMDYKEIGEMFNGDIVQESHLEAQIPLDELFTTEG